MSALCDKCQTLKACEPLNPRSEGGAEEASASRKQDEQVQDEPEQNERDPDGEDEEENDEENEVEDEENQDGDEQEEQEAPSIEWHGGLKDVISSAASCVLCALVVKGWRESRKDVIERNLESGDISPDYGPPDLNDDIADIEAYAHQDKAVVSVGFLKEKRAAFGGTNAYSTFLRFDCCPKSRGSWQAYDPLQADFRIAREEIQPSGDSESVKDAYDEIINVDPLSSQSLRIAKSWVQACVETHGGICSAPTQLVGDRAVPSRLLDVASQDGRIHLRLLEDMLKDPAHKPNERPSFVALSHCWGQGGTPFTTTRETFEQRKEGVDVKEMPQTFQDAVAVVRALGLRYIWIDSLCILQDDLQDWYHESKEMATIYRDAYLVLGAARGVSDATGFLGPRERRDAVRLPWTADTSPLTLLLLPRERRRWTDRNGPDPLENEPLCARSWCLQERSLPRRSLQYAKNCMMWECGAMRASEEGDTVSQNGSHLERICQTANIPSSVFRRPARGPYEEKVDVNGVGWYTMLQDFTARGITKHTDRLPALSGLAAAVSKAGGDSYLAGLWKSNLVEGLMWCHASRKQALGLPGDYIAPSWSWASVVGPVHFPMYDWYSRALWKAKMSDFEALAEYLSHNIVTAGPDPHGRLTSGVLRLKAPLIKVKSVQRRPDKPPAGPRMWGQAPMPSPFTSTLFSLQEDDAAGPKEMWIEGGFDQKVDTNVQRSLFVLFLTRLPHVLEDGFLEHRFGLVVEEAPKSAAGAYQRIGFVDGVVLERTDDDDHDDAGYRAADYITQRRQGDMDDTERPNDLAPYTAVLEASEVALI